MKKLFIVLIVVFLSAEISGASYAMEKKDGDMPMHMSSNAMGYDGHSPMLMFKKLGLDDKQKEAIRAIHLRTRKEAIRKEADLKLAKIELMEVLTKEPVDMAAAEAAVKKIEGLKTDMKMLHIRAMEEVKANLNDEQKKKFTAMATRFLMQREDKRCDCRACRIGGGMKKGDMKRGKK